MSTALSLGKTQMENKAREIDNMLPQVSIKFVKYIVWNANHIFSNKLEFLCCLLYVLMLLFWSIMLWYSCGVSICSVQNI